LAGSSAGTPSCRRPARIRKLQVEVVGDERARQLVEQLRGGSAGCRRHRGRPPDRPGPTPKNECHTRFTAARANHGLSRPRDPACQQRTRVGAGLPVQLSAVEVLRRDVLVPLRQLDPRRLGAVRRFDPHRVPLDPRAPGRRGEERRVLPELLLRPAPAGAVGVGTGRTPSGRRGTPARWHRATFFRFVLVCGEVVGRVRAGEQLNGRAWS